MVLQPINFLLNILALKIIQIIFHTGRHH